MRIHALGPAVASLALAWSVSAQAQTTPGAADAGTARRWVEACLSRDAETVARLDAVDTAMDGEASLVEIQQALDALRATPCFALAALEGDDEPFVTAEVARRWWLEGGQDWASQYVAFGAGDRREIVLAPTRRGTLAREVAAPDDPLRSLLCADGDVTCGRETAGWVLRAERAFEDHARRERERDRERREEDDEDDEDDDEPTDCATEAREASAEDRYLTFRACEETRRPRQSALPVGRMRAPTEGWLIVRGRRGHYRFRDEVRAYDLATGAAYVVSSGSALVLRRSGAVDGASTDAGRAEVDQVGRLSAEAVRELAWMLFVGERVEERHAPVAYVALPRGVEPRAGADASVFPGLHLSAWFSSAQTQLDWSWVVRGRVLHRGSLTWPESGGAAEDHAAQLLRIAEATFLPGCAPAALPVLPRPPPAGGVSALDAEPGALAHTEDALFDRLLALRAPRCR